MSPSNNTNEYGQVSLVLLAGKPEASHYANQIIGCLSRYPPRRLESPVQGPKGRTQGS